MDDEDDHLDESSTVDKKQLLSLEAAIPSILQKWGDSPSAASCVQ